jgi:hypothetical protein
VGVEGRGDREAAGRRWREARQGRRGVPDHSRERDGGTGGGGGLRDVKGATNMHRAKDYELTDDGTGGGVKG